MRKDDDDEGKIGNDKEGDSETTVESSHEERKKERRDSSGDRSGDHHENQQKRSRSRGDDLEDDDETPKKSKAGKIYCLRVESSILICQQVIAISVKLAKIVGPMSHPVLWSAFCGLLKAALQLCLIIIITLALVESGKI